VYRQSLYNTIFNLSFFFCLSTHINEHPKDILIPFIWTTNVWLDVYAGLTPNGCGWFNEIIHMVIFFSVADGIKATHHVADCSFKFQTSYIDVQKYFSNSIYLYYVLSNLFKYQVGDKIKILKFWIVCAIVNIQQRILVIITK